MSRSIAVASLVALSLASVGCRHAPPADEADESTQSHKPKRDAPAADERVQRFVFVALALEPYGMVPIDEESARGRWHVRLISRKSTPDTIDRVERISPRGRVYTTWSYARGETGITSTERDARDVKVSVTRVNHDGTRTQTARSGVVGEYGCHHLEIDYDADGVQRERRCLDADRKLVPDQDGCAVRSAEHDARKLTTKVACVDGDGKPAAFSSGAHSMTYEHDRWGQLTHTRYFGIDGRPLAHGAGCASESYAYDDAGNGIEWNCLDGDGATTRARKTKFDRGGCRVREDNVSATGGLVLWDGVASRIFKRDDVCTLLDEETRDVDGKLVGAIASRKNLLDDDGNAIETRCLDADSKPTSCSGGRVADGAITRASYDDKGRMVRSRGFKIDGSKSHLSVGHDHEIRTSYGADGRKELDEFFDVEGKPGKSNGASQLRYRYDSIGAETSQAFFDGKGAPIIAAFGCHEIRSTFDDRHALLSRECLDTTGALRDSNLCQGMFCWGVHTARIAVERREGHVDNLHYDARGALTSRVSCEKERCLR
ncbi:MAG: hypothetical protein ACHREM_19100 [Polyangiales bacterium]